MHLESKFPLVGLLDSHGVAYDDRYCIGKPACEFFGQKGFGGLCSGCFREKKKFREGRSTGNVEIDEKGVPSEKIEENDSSSRRRRQPRTADIGMSGSLRPAHHDVHDGCFLTCQMGRFMVEDPSKGACMLVCAYDPDDHRCEVTALTILPEKSKLASDREKAFTKLSDLDEMNKDIAEISLSRGGKYALIAAVSKVLYASGASEELAKQSVGLMSDSLIHTSSSSSNS